MGPIMTRCVTGDGLWPNTQGQYSNMAQGTMNQSTYKQQVVTGADNTDTLGCQQAQDIKGLGSCGK